MQKVVEKVPTFEALSQDGRSFRLEDLRGRWVVLYFYPKDKTVGCIAGVYRSEARPRSHAEWARRELASRGAGKEPPA